MPALRPEGRAGRAFGLDIRSDFPCIGLPHGGPGDEVVLLERVPRSRLTNRMPRGAARLWELRAPNGRRVVRIDADPEVGYFLSAVGYGNFLIDPQGASVECAPVHTSPARWQRYLVGQVLPFVALVRGHEVFHASVMAIGGRAVACIGRSRAGKSTLAAAMALRGAAYVADDVLVVRPDRATPSGQLLAQPGFGLMSVRREAIELLGSAELDGLGPQVAGDDDAVRFGVDVVREAVPVHAVCFIERTEQPVEQILTSMSPVDPRLLLAGSFNFIVRDPARLIRQLDVCATLARTARILRITIGPGVHPCTVAAAVEESIAATAARTGG